MIRGYLIIIFLCHSFVVSRKIILIDFMVYGFLTKIMFGMKKATRSFWVNIVPVLFSFPELCISAEMKLTVRQIY